MPGKIMKSLILYKKMYGDNAPKEISSVGMDQSLNKVMVKKNPTLANH